ncbi:hypothetical protein [Pseudomonas aeruginosa]|uniref:hypothetical protein n=1 Tax=Pseudomonas aeruginosa TaxID=287 RepID=UPI0028FFAB98|nr:hypothetical protein [Pseudomonas aeruginosa]MDU0679448.1 hypothetical protein [Pseudomonas aeruginosa]
MSGHALAKWPVTIYRNDRSRWAEIRTNALIGVSFSALVTNEGEQIMVLAYAGTPALLEVAGQVDGD